MNIDIDATRHRVRRPVLTAGAVVLTTALVLAAPVAAFAHNGPNTAPFGGTDSYTVVEGHILNAPDGSLLANDGDVDGDGFQADSFTPASHGFVNAFSQGSFEYTPAFGYVGPDHFTYIVWDIHGAPSGVVDVFIDVLPDNTPEPVTPTIVSDWFWTTAGDTLVTMPAWGLLANDVDVPAGATVTVASDVSHGSISIDASTGAFSYVPDAGFSGTDTFTYDVTADGWSGSAFAVIDVYGPNLGVPPVTNPDSYTTPAGTTLLTGSPGLMANDSVLAGDLTAWKSSDGAHGSVTIAQNGFLTYVPDQGFVGTDTFTYYAKSTIDNLTVSAPTLITVEVLPKTAPINPGQLSPAAGDDFYLAVAGQQLDVVTLAGLLVNDSDPNNVGITAEYLTTPAHGGITPLADGSFSYLPDAGFTGTDTFTYRVTESGGLNPSNVATVSINVQPSVVGLDEAPQLPTEADPIVPSTPAALAQTGSDSAWIVLLSFLLLSAGGLAVRFTRKPLVASDES